MSLLLDARQRAMLEEMGVRVFAPLPAEEPEFPVAQAVEDYGRTEAPAAPVLREERRRVEPAAPAALARAPAPAPGRQPVAAEGPGLEVGSLDWDALAQSAAELAAGRRMVFGSGDPRAGWLLVGEPLTEEEELDGAPFTGQAGKLLDNMLGALGLHRRQGVYLTNAVKARPGSAGLRPEELAGWSAVLRRQVELVQPRVVLAMGRFPLQLLLEGNEPLGRMRGRAHACGGVPVVVTYAPGYLLRAMPDKAKAWADLCLARSLVA